MTARRSNQKFRCQKCLLNQMWCLCSQIPTFNNQVRLSIVMHFKEQYLPSNTAHFAHLMLHHSELILRGKINSPITDSLKISPLENTYYLFPDEEAVEINEEFCEKIQNKKIHLIVPDGTWSQAKKIKKREPILTQIPSVKINPKNPSIYKLRRQVDDFGLCTLEAIAYAMGQLESLDMEIKMLNFLKIFNNQVIKSRNSQLALD
jgi:DTW domain-containing protein YfiP